MVGVVYVLDDLHSGRREQRAENLFLSALREAALMGD